MEGKGKARMKRREREKGSETEENKKGKGNNEGIRNWVGSEAKRDTGEGNQVRVAT